MNGRKLKPQQVSIASVFTYAEAKYEIIAHKYIAVTLQPEPGNPKLETLGRGGREVQRN